MGSYFCFPFKIFSWECNEKVLLKVVPLFVLIPLLFFKVELPKSTFFLIDLKFIDYFLEKFHFLIENFLMIAKNFMLEDNPE